MLDFRGYPACACLVEWLPVYERELQDRGVLDGPLRIYQLIGGAAASGGTHATGGAFDVTDLVGDVDVWVARQMGADATWARTAAQGFTPHLHGVLRGCPHNGPARYQIDAVDAGFNGLGSGGRGAPDDGPRPLSKRTWRQGIEWAKQQEADMPLNQDDKDFIRNAIRSEATAAVEGLLNEEQANGKTLRENIRIGANARDLVREVLAEMDKG